LKVISFSCAFYAGSVPLFVVFFSLNVITFLQFFGTHCVHHDFFRASLNPDMIFLENSCS